ncbi:beta-lactamase/transpeptidase-like protein [Polyplosphaeria fusca]|uniref:Beta-lactamase/transpeptidase-like protein n=1 Tax=Polyplosphaeria fusca TaxID=682080 RepID=A0A9P4V724_9PLEO|nr:beta-lactamase/transpeptidase-like protein [Polyplosphaeria fusca]
MPKASSSRDSGGGGNIPNEQRILEDNDSPVADTATAIELNQILQLCVETGTYALKLGEIFSTTDDKPILDFHKPGANLVNSSVDGDSIYRIASTSKVITVYLLLLQAGDQIFGDLVTKFLPELAGHDHWDEITVGSLADYTANIVSDIFDINLISGGDLNALFPDAFPRLTPNETSPCAYGKSGCTRDIFISELLNRTQVYLPGTTPAYSNAAFATLGLILESATGMPYAEAMEQLLSKPLSLQSTFASAPTVSSRAVLVGSEEASGWNTIISDAGIGMGALYSTPNELSTIGRSILSSTLLPSNTTRTWLRPTTHTSSLIGAVGHAWEIFRAQIGDPENNRVVDLYTKGGNFGAYGANMVLIPDFDVGFVVLMAGARGGVPYAMSGIIVDELLPALEETARRDADAKFSGTYRATGSNSTLTLSSTQGIPGLSIDTLVLNSTDLRNNLYGSPENFQMYPTNVMRDGGGISWRSSFVSTPDTGAFSACPSWGAVDRPQYGRFGIDEFAFYEGKDDRAERVVFWAMGAEMVRVGGGD